MDKANNRIQPPARVGKQRMDMFLAACEGRASQEEFEKGLLSGRARASEGLGRGGIGPLHAAARGVQSEHARQLIEAGADPNLRDDVARSPLMVACGQGAADIAKALLEAGARVDCLSAQGRSPLMEAASVGSAECVELLLGAGAQVDYGLTTGWTALTEACRAGRFECARILLAAGASVAGELAPPPLDSEDHRGGGQDEEPVVRCWEPILSAAVGGRVECVRALLAAGASPDARDGQGHTGLMLALSRKEGACAFELMAAGADLDAVDLGGRQAWDHAGDRRDHWREMFAQERLRREVAALEVAAAPAASKPKLPRL